MVVTKRLGEWKWRVINGCRVLVLQVEKKIPEICCKALLIYLTLLNCTFKMVKILNIVLCNFFITNNFLM